MAKEQDIILTEEEQALMDEQMEEYKAHKRQKHEEMVALQRLPYEDKLEKAKMRIREFIDECDKRDLNCHVSVGGRDSIVLLALIRSMGYGPDEVPAISVSGLEDASIIKVHKEMGVIMLKPHKKKQQVIEEYGWPVGSKKVTNKIAMLQNANEGNETTRHAIITGECGRQGHFQKNSKMQLAKKWLELFGGWDEEGAALGYKHPNWLASDKCCYWLKEKPCDDWAKEHNSVPFLGLMASEGGRRQDALEEHGCNYFGKTTIRSCPFSPWMTWEVIRLGVELGVHFPEIYGEVRTRPGRREWDTIEVVYEHGELVKTVKHMVYEYDEYYSTGESRTGCDICGFGVQMEGRPHRFDRLFERNQKLWWKIMTAYARDLDGNLIGWGDVLDYIGVEWREPWKVLNGCSGSEIAGQMNLFDYLGYEVGGKVIDVSNY